jgi:cytosine/adenosine deaminase-related metal-dependent hydrolase
VPVDTPVIDAPELVLVPGFVNAHAHLALTALGGRFAPTEDFWGWIIDLVEERRKLGQERLREGAAEGLILSLAAGTTTLLDFAPLSSHDPSPRNGVAGGWDKGEGGRGADSPVRLLRAPEIICPDPAETARVVADWMALDTPLAAPHAVYTTTPELLELLSDQTRRRHGVFTMHLSETRDENREWMVGHCDGMRRFHDHFGIDRTHWQAPRCSPTQYLARLSGVLGPHVLLVHCNYLSEGDIAIIAATGASVCLCPATHRFFGHTQHPLAQLLAAGVPVCLGTDSLCSSPSLSMWDQVRIVAEGFPQIPWQTLLKMITSGGARALGLGEMLGTLQPAAPADLVLLWPRPPIEEIGENPRCLFESDAAVDEVLIGGKRVSELPV